ncbi:hypothetical protein QJS10_CPB12g00748 [Acorus calamus]|uniref:Uncharacterized protein n=1 Tax=Acorus calamus TaxID=4465 RepID=A0AAV9DN86_ACOCL|nr:hypothetical protein QJS10_CPB12g00748 [Acorus calamus]
MGECMHAFHGFEFYIAYCLGVFRGGISMIGLIPEGGPIHGNGPRETDNENTVEQPNAMELANIQNTDTSDTHSLSNSMWDDLIRQPSQIFHNVD